MLKIFMGSCIVGLFQTASRKVHIVWLCWWNGLGHVCVDNVWMWTVFTPPPPTLLQSLISCFKAFGQLHLARYTYGPSTPSTKVVLAFAFHLGGFQKQMNLPASLPPTSSLGATCLSLPFPFLSMFCPSFPTSPSFPLLQYLLSLTHHPLISFDIVL